MLIAPFNIGVKTIYPQDPMTAVAQDGTACCYCKVGDRMTAVAQRETACCCKVDPEDETEGWVRVPYLDADQEGQVVPGVLVYLPVTILRQAGREVS